MSKVSVSPIHYVLPVTFGKDENGELEIIDPNTDNLCEKTSEGINRTTDNVFEITCEDCLKLYNE